MSEMTADEIFENLKYLKLEEITQGEFKKVTYNNPRRLRIVFGINKNIGVFNEKFQFVGVITMQELQAIHKKCEELGWFE